MNLPSKIWDGKVVAGPNGCHIWMGAIGQGRDGYGYIWKNGKTRKTHRLMYEECWGPIPEGLMVCHRCNVKRCVNPLHLYAGSAVDNMQDRLAETGTVLTPEWRAKLDKANALQKRSRNAQKVSMEPERAKAGGGEW